MPCQSGANANWMRFEENSLDTAHTNFVHCQFGAKRKPLDAWRSRAIGWQSRNFLLEPEQDAERMAGILRARAPAHG